MLNMFCINKTVNKLNQLKQSEKNVICLGLVAVTGVTGNSNPFGCKAFKFRKCSSNHFVVEDKRAPSCLKMDPSSMLTSV